MGGVLQAHPVGARRGRRGGTARDRGRRGGGVPRRRPAPAALPERAPEGRPAGRAHAARRGPRRAQPDHHGEAVRHRPGLGAQAQQRAPPGLRRGADLPDRPLPGQGGGAEHPRLPLRQRAVRADLAPQPHRARPDRRARGARPGPAGRLLRVDRRLPRHGGHPPVPGAGLHRDGAADRPGAVRDQRGEEQGLPLDAADRAARRRPRPVHRLPRHRRASGPSRRPRPSSR